MKVVIQTVNLKNGDELNFSAKNCPKLPLGSDFADRFKDTVIANLDGKEWSSMVCVILP